MTQRRSSHIFWQGVKAGSPFILVVAPFALLFGVVATEAGLDLLQTMSMSFLVIAGAAQFTAISLMQENTPILIVLGTSLAVNLRMAMYSASLAPHIGSAPLWKRALAAYLLVDQSYGVAIQRFEEDPSLTAVQKITYFFGVAFAVCPLWYVMTLIGALVGSAIPPEYALDFAVPITFIALIAPWLKSVPHIAAAFVSVTAALFFAWMPYKTGLLVAAALAMATGACVELWLERRRG